MDYYTISEICSELKFSKRSFYRFENMGLIPEPAIKKQQFRIWNHKQKEEIAFIIKARKNPKFLNEQLLKLKNLTN